MEKRTSKQHREKTKKQTLTMAQWRLVCFLTIVSIVPLSCMKQYPETSEEAAQECDSLMEFPNKDAPGRQPASVDYRSNIAYNHPDTMLLGETENITLVIGKLDLYDLEKLVDDEFQEGVHIATTTRELAKEISAELIGTNFEIAPKGERKQMLTDEKLRWEWSVKPLSCGTHTLSLIIYKWMETDGKGSKQQLRALRDDIFVYVPESPWYKTIIAFIMNHFEWLFTLIVIPLIIRFRKKLTQYLKKKKQ